MALDPPRPVRYGDAMTNRTRWGLVLLALAALALLTPGHTASADRPCASCGTDTTEPEETWPPDTTEAPTTTEATTTTTTVAVGTPPIPTAVAPSSTVGTPPSTDGGSTTSSTPTTTDLTPPPTRAPGSNSLPPAPTPTPSPTSPTLPVTGPGDGVAPWALLVLALGALLVLVARRPA